MKVLLKILFDNAEEYADFSKRMNGHVHELPAAPRVKVRETPGPTPLPRPEPLPRPQPEVKAPAGPEPVRVKCTECGTEFEQSRPTQHQCGKKCYMKAYWRNYKPGQKKGKGKTTTEKLAELKADSIPPVPRPALNGRDIG